MGKKTNISWCDHSHNEWWGCHPVSPECDNCYARYMADILGRSGMNEPIFGLGTPRRLWPEGHKHENELRNWHRRAEKEQLRHRVFSFSMGDVFENHHQLTPARNRFFRDVEQTPWLDHLILTKHPKNVLRMVPDAWKDAFPENIWMGVTCGIESSLWRVHALLEIPASIRWVSAEPLLGDFSLLPFMDGSLGRKIDWVVPGGESGVGGKTPCHDGSPGRPRIEMDDAWARRHRDDCLATGTAFFFKQKGGITPKARGNLLDGVLWHQYPKNRKGERGVFDAEPLPVGT